MYEDQRDDDWYYNQLNPAEQNLLWMHRWKQQALEIHKELKQLRQTTYTDEYVREFVDGSSLEPSNPVALNILEMEKEVDSFVKDIMNSDQGRRNKPVTNC